MKLGDPIVLRSTSIVGRPRSTINSVVVDLGFLTVLFVRTARGELAYKFEVRSNRYARKKEMGTLIHKLAKHVYGDYQRRWYQENHERIRRRERAFHEKNRTKLIVSVVKPMPQGSHYDESAK